MLHQPLAVLVGRDLPQLFQAEAEFLRLALPGEIELRDELLAEIAARAFREQRVFGAQFHAAGEAVLRLLVLADAHVAGGDAGDRAVIVVEHFGRGKARIDFDAERFGLGGQPAADTAERDDEVAVIVHQRRHHEVRQPQPAVLAEEIKAVVGDRGLDRRIFGAPFRQQLVDPDWIDHRAGEDVGADLGALLHDHDGDVRIDLLEADGGGEARPAPRRRSPRRIPSPRGRAKRRSQPWRSPDSAYPFTTFAQWRQSPGRKARFAAGLC